MPTTSSSTYAILPVKSLRQAKSRLARALKAPTRAALVRAIFSRTLDVITQVERITHTVVVSRDPTILELARQRPNVTALAEAEAGLNPAITQGAIWARDHGAGSIVIVPVDLPLLSVADLDAMLDLALEERCVVIAPDRRDDGTIKQARLCLTGGCFQNKIASSLQQSVYAGWRAS